MSVVETVGGFDQAAEIRESCGAHCTMWGDKGSCQRRARRDWNNKTMNEDCGKQWEGLRKPNDGKRCRETARD